MSGVHESHRDDAIAPRLTCSTDSNIRSPTATILGPLRGLLYLSRRLLAGREGRVRHFLRRADRARDAGDCAVAASLYRRALALDVGRADIRVQLAHMLKELAHFGEAEAAYRQALAQTPEDGDIQLQLGHLLKLLGRTDDATAAYSAAHRLLNGSEAAAVEPRALGASGDDACRTDTVAAEEHIVHGDRLRDGGRYGEAAEAYGNALSLAPTRTDIRIQYGNMLKDSGRQAEAESAYRCALARAPGNAEIYLQLGHVFKLQGRREDALAAYRRAADMQPALEAAWAELSDAGCPESQQRCFETQVARGGVDALLAVSEEVMRLRDSVARLAETLPDLCGQMAFPVSAYDRFRSLYDVPEPPASGRDLRFGVILSTSGRLDTLYAQITSLTAQTYQNWQLAVLGTDAAQRRVVERAAASDPRISWVEADRDEASGTAERRIALSLSADWLVLLASGARLHRHALAWFGATIGQGTAVAFVTDEEAAAGPDGTAGRLIPQFRQAVDYDTLLEANPFGETVAVERAAYAAVAGDLIMASLSAARGSLLLALASRRAVGHIPLPLVTTDSTDSTNPDGAAVHQSAVRAHLAAAGLAHRVTIGTPASAASPLPIWWEPRNPNEILQVIIPTRDNGNDLRDLVQSLRRRAAVPDALRVLIVDNGSRNTETVRILAELDAEEWVRVVPIDEPFNWSRLNNRAVLLCTSELLVFVNDDMLMLTDGWDRQLRGLLERTEIGAIGARLIYPDDTVQHAGILLGWPGIAVHDGRYEPISRPGPCCRWHVTRAVSAVTGAFLAVRRDVFEASGGFDETGLPVSYSDVDFALKLRARGLSILWTPSITLRHYESKSRGLDHLDTERRVRNEVERRLIEQRWGAALQVDPSVNPAWHAATLPFRLISAPAQQRLWRHIRLCASGNPWLPESRPEPEARPVPDTIAAGPPKPLPRQSGQLKGRTVGGATGVDKGEDWG